MKLDIYTNRWLEIVFEGKNKNYGAYDLRKTNKNTTLLALAVGAVLFFTLVNIPNILKLVPEKETEKEVVITLNSAADMKEEVKEKPKENLPPPPPPPPKVDVVKFVKPVVAKKEEVVEEVVVVKEIEDKTIGKENIKGDPTAKLEVFEKPVGDGPKIEKVVEAEDTKIYNTAGIEVKPDFPGGIKKFYEYIGKNYQTPEEEGLKGKVYVTFVVEKDGSLTDIKVIKDIGYGTGK